MISSKANMNTQSQSLPRSRKKNSYNKLFGMIAMVCCILLGLQKITYQNMIVPEDADQHDLKSKSQSHGDDGDLSLARDESFGFFDDITTNQWKLYQKIVAEHINHKYPEGAGHNNLGPWNHHPEYDSRHMKYFNSYPAWWQTNYEPNFSCPFERRIGCTFGCPNGNGDGPKWICDPHRIQRLALERKKKDPTHPGCVIYSIGSNGDFSFEMGMQEVVGKGVCEFHIFDMGDYESRVPKDLERAYYHRYGLAKQSQNTNYDVPPEGQKFYGILDVVKMLGHENLEAIDVFKIDCEGCEWRTYQDWFMPGIPHLMQIQVELHNAHKDAIKFFDTFEEAGYVRFHKEPNIQFNDGSCQEYAFLKLKKDFFRERQERLKKMDQEKKEEGK